MEYLEAKATATPTTDLGEFTALVAVFGNTDRGGDRIQPGAFAKSISEWREVGRRVPLHYEHDPHVIIGDIDADQMWESDEGLEVSGRIDLDDKLGRRVWKSLKRGRIAFSFGYLTVKSRERENGGTDLLELDVFEVSTTSQPMNNRTGVLSVKGAATTQTLTESQTEILRVLRPEWEAKREAEVQAEEEAWEFNQHFPRRRTRIAFNGCAWVEVDEEPEEEPVNMLGVQVRPSDITINGQ